MSKGENKDKKEDLHKQFKPNRCLKEYSDGAFGGAISQYIICNREKL